MTHLDKQLEKAVEWLHSKVDPKRYPCSVVTNTRGYAEFVAYVFRLKDRRDVWYCLDVDKGKATRIRRICR